MGEKVIPQNGPDVLGPSIPFRRKAFNWKPVRDEYISYPERKTWEELSEQFAIPAQRISVTAADEGWALMRARHTAALVERSGAHEILLAAAATQRSITDKFSNVALATTEQLQSVLDDAKMSTYAPSSRTQVLNTVGFTLLNLARALKESGVVGLPKALMDKLEERKPQDGDGKDFLKNALQQINLTVNLAREGRSGDAVVEKVVTKEERHAMKVEIPDRQTKEGKEVDELIREAEAKSMHAEFDEGEGPL